MAYKHDMSNESKRKILLPEGFRKFEIRDCKEKISSKGNDMFIFTLKDIKTGQEDIVYATAVKGKRWFLKQILTACDVAAGQDGIYEWDIPDVLGKTIAGNIYHDDEEYINRDNKLIKFNGGRFNESISYKLRKFIAEISGS